MLSICLSSMVSIKNYQKYFYRIVSAVFYLQLYVILKSANFYIDINSQEIPKIVLYISQQKK